MYPSGPWILVMLFACLDCGEQYESDERRRCRACTSENVTDIRQAFRRAFRLYRETEALRDNLLAQVTFEKNETERRNVLLEQQRRTIYLLRFQIEDLERKLQSVDDGRCVCEPNKVCTGKAEDNAEVDDGEVND